MDSLKKDHKEKQQRFQSERNNIFTFINFFYYNIYKIALTLNDDKRIQSVDLIEIFEYETSKDLLSKKEEIKCSNIIKLCKKRLTLMMLQKKT